MPDVPEGACIEVRARNAEGAVSERTRLCGDEIGRVQLTSEPDYPTSCEPYLQAAVLASASDVAAPTSSTSASGSGGCGLVAPGAASGAGGLLLGLLSLVLHQRRRR